jgi:nitrous oxidase accessory protein NosD
MKNFKFFVHSISFFILLLFVALPLYGQFPYDEDFEESECPELTIHCGGVIDDDDCLEDWSTSHGTPHIDAFNMHGGEYCLFLGYRLNQPETAIVSEGAFANLRFEEDNCYLISFWYRFNREPTTGSLPILESELKVKLANGLTYNNPFPPSGCFEAAGSASSTQEIFSENTYDLDVTMAYRKAEFIFTADDDYDHLWFYFETDLDINGSMGGTIRIDDLHIEEVDCNFPCSCPGEGDQIGEAGEITSIELDTDFDGTIPSGCYEVAGTLLIDEVTIAYGVQFIMQPGAEIVNSSIFRVSNSSFESCVHMWKGIQVESSSRLIFQNNEIYDAQYAIELLHNSRISMAGNLFDRNYIGVYAHHTTPGGNIYQEANMDANSFTCSGQLLTPFEGQTPDPGERSLAGLFIENINGFAVGVYDNATIVNTFDEMRNGIIAARLNVNIHYCVIEDMHGMSSDYFSPYTDMSGIGIYLVGCPSGLIRRNSISDLHQGILTFESNSRIEANEISDMRMGIQSEFIPVHTGILWNILTGGRGIWTFGNYFTFHTIIFNEIELENNNAVSDGIKVQYCVNSETGIDNFDIIGNIIETNGINQRGIAIEYTRYLEANENEITQNSFITDWAAGILLHDATDLQIRNNTVTGFDTDDNYPGTEVMNSEDVMYCCNTIDATEIGLHFFGACNGSTIATTQFNNHDRGLVYDASAVTGAQGSNVLSHGNFWHEDCVDLEAEHEGGLLASLNSRYFVLNGEGADDVDPTGWFGMASGDPNNCENWANCGEDEWLTPLISGTDSAFVKNELSGIAFEDVVTWLGKQGLYRKLVENPSLTVSNSLMDHFKDTTATSEIGRLYYIDSLFVRAVSMSDSLFEIVTDRHDRIVGYMNKLDTLNGLLQGANPVDSALILLQKDTVLEDLLVVAEEYHEEIDSFLTHRQTKLTFVESVNDTVTVSTHPATNEKTVNRLAISYWLDEFTLGAGDISDLYDIGIECPLVGGNAVFRARSLHDMVTKEAVNWDSLANCASFYSPRLKNPDEVKISKLLIYPNPTDGSFTIELENKEDNPTQISLFNLNGRKIISQAVNGNPVQLDGSHLPQGVYSIQILLDNGEILSGRIVILH